MDKNPNTQAQLENIRNMMRLTKDNLSKLNEKFAGFQHPPQMYISEYEQLTTKLNEFQNQEQKLTEQLSEENASDQYCVPNNSDIQFSPLNYSNEFNFDPSYSFPRLRQNNSSLNMNSISSFHSNNNTPPTPKSPFKSVVRAFLPNQQRTTVQVKPGQTVKEALSKALIRRELTPEMCDLTLNEPFRRINWDDDISNYEGGRKFEDDNNEEMFTKKADFKIKKMAKNENDQVFTINENLEDNPLIEKLRLQRLEELNNIDFEPWETTFSELKSIYESEETVKEDQSQINSDTDSIKNNENFRVTRSNKRNIDIANENNQSDEKRQGKRQIKKKFDSQEWVTNSYSRKKKGLECSNSSITSDNETDRAIYMIKVSANDDDKTVQVEKVSDELIYSAEKKSSPSKSSTEINIQNASLRSNENPETSEVQNDSSHEFDESEYDIEVNSENKELLSMKTEYCVRGKKHSATLAQWKEGVKCPKCTYMGHSAPRLEQHLAKQVHFENPDQIPEEVQEQIIAHYQNQQMENVSITIGDNVYESQLIVTPVNPNTPKNGTCETTNAPDIQVTNVSDQEILDKTFNLTIKHPPLSYFVRQAAGIERGAVDPSKEVAGKITVKHVYEIAKLKSEDPDYEFIPLQKVCDDVVKSARSLGVQVVHRLDPIEYAEFLKERKEVVKKQIQELQESKEAKLLRN
ncbi:hypothetical protein RND71_043537 [Anisodus tanguticus]|uniref:Large ribosomal subunit protein uL11m n=1 Tax=Anisodus tanguticus TaxID=243964 RepID=A0AAE1QQD8_9SOLA|nr:hypothetical protein RND71_043537 [Anisodus tanguticus]